MEHSLLENLRRGDTTAIQLIYADAYPSVERYVCINSGLIADAEDVFQESMVVLYKRLRDKDFKLTSQVSTFIIAIAKRIWLDRLRRKKMVATAPLSDSIIDLNEDIIEEIRKNEIQHLFQRHFEQLKADCKKLLTLFFEGKKMKEIAETMNIGSIAYAKKKKFNCKNHLLNSIKQDPAFQELKNESVTSKPIKENEIG